MTHRHRQGRDRPGRGHRHGADRRRRARRRGSSASPCCPATPSARRTRATPPAASRSSSAASRCGWPAPRCAPRRWSAPQARLRAATSLRWPTAASCANGAATGQDYWTVAAEIDLAATRPGPRRASRPPDLQVVGQSARAARPAGQGERRRRFHPRHGARRHAACPRGAPAQPRRHARGARRGRDPPRREGRSQIVRDGQFRRLRESRSRSGLEAAAAAADHVHAGKDNVGAASSPSSRRPPG